MKIFIALGANLPSAVGPPLVTLTSALEEFAACQLEIEARSSWYRSAAFPDPTDPEFVNGVVAVRSDLPPFEVLRALHDIERRYGRSRRTKWAPRTLDLDIIDYGGRSVDAQDDGLRLKLPHPRLAERAFVLLPLAEIAPDWTHPLTGAQVKDLIKALPADQTAARM